MNGVRNIVEWSFDDKGGSQINFRCCSFVLFNYVFLHWHYGGSFNGMAFPHKIRLRSVEVGRWILPFKYYEI